MNRSSLFVGLLNLTLLIFSLAFAFSFGASIAVFSTGIGIFLLAIPLLIVLLGVWKWIRYYRGARQELNLIQKILLWVPVINLALILFFTFLIISN